MKIDKLSDEQKTVMLAKLAGVTPDVMNSGVLCVDLYDPANMQLAWRVLNWAASQGITTQIHVIYQYKRGDWARMIDLAAADAQRAWLDYILRKAIEAGIVEPVKNYPTKWGLERYPPNGIYTGGFGEQDKDWWLPCTCTQRCETPCKGECGCQACDMAYNDYLSME